MEKHVDLYQIVRMKLETTGLPYIIENVIGAPYMTGFVLCGSMFDLKVRRHRNFETSFAVLVPSCEHKKQGRPYTITGEGGPCDTKHSLKPAQSEFPVLMNMPWATPYEASQAIPPAYTEWIGERLQEYLLWQKDH